MGRAAITAHTTPTTVNTPLVSPPNWPSVTNRTWLQARYETLQKLNEVWGTALWSQHYSDWNEIQPPRAAPAGLNPTQQLDWMRFSSDSWLECFEEQKAILRQITPIIPVTTNF